jgi:hypothetical protein
MGAMTKQFPVLLNTIGKITADEVDMVADISYSYLGQHCRRHHDIDAG